MGEYVAVEVIDADHRDVEGRGETFGKRCSHEEGANQARSCGEGNRAEVGFLNSGALDGLGDHRYDILLVGTGCELGNDAPESLVHTLACNDVGEQDAVFDYGC